MENKKKKVSRLIIFSLVLINISVVIFLLSNKPDDSPKYGEFIQENLRFNENQLKQYHNLIREHRKSLFSINHKIIKAKNILYKELNNNKFNQKEVDQKINTLNKYQKELETLNFNHFLKIKQICSSKQLTDFKKISKEFPLFFRPN